MEYGISFYPSMDSFMARRGETVQIRAKSLKEAMDEFIEEHGKVYTVENLYTLNGRIRKFRKGAYASMICRCATIDSDKAILIWLEKQRGGRK